MDPAQVTPHAEKTDQFPTALIVGGAGFLGSYLCQSLLQKALKVICIDNLSTGKKESIEPLLKNPAFSFLEKDINTVSFIGKIKPDYVFHLAGVEEYINGVDISLETLLANSLGTKNILDLVKETNAKFLLISTLSVYEGILSGVSLQDDFGLTQKDTQKYTHHEAKRFSEALVAEYYRKFKIDARVARVKDCYGPRMPLEEGSVISKLFKEAKETGKLQIEGEGLDVLHPTFVTDVAEGIEKAMFAHGTTGKIFSLLVPEETTIINFAYELKRQSDKPLTIEFIPTKEILKFPRKTAEVKKTEEDLNWKPRVSLSQGIKTTLEFFNTEGKVPRQPLMVTEEITLASRENLQKTDSSTLSNANSPVVSIVKKTPATALLNQKKTVPIISVSGNNESKKKPRRFPLLFSPRIISVALSVFFLSAFLLFPVGRVGLETLLGINRLASAQTFLKAGKFPEAQISSQNSRNNFLNAKNTLNYLSWLFTLTKQRKLENDLHEELDMGEKLGEVASHASQLGAIMLGSSNSQGPVDIVSLNEDTISSAKVEMGFIDEKLSIIQALGGPNKMSCPLNAHFCQDITGLIKRIPKIRTILTKGETVIDKLPEMLGNEVPKTYLLLLANNMELRGGGGFIGSYGLLKLEDGKITDLKIQDIYAIDGQLKGHVTPPDEVLHYLGQPDWYLRDSNLSADFPVNARRAVWFFEKETGIQVDGVISLDLSFIKSLLEVTGPLKLPDYKTSISRDNLFQEAEAQTEVNFFPGSTQKKDFLSQLGRVLLSEMTSDKNKNLPLLFEKVSGSIDERHLQIYFPNTDFQDLIENIGAGGEIKADYCEPKSSCLGSSLLISENNFGANKVNYFLKRNISRTVTVGKEGEVREKVTIKYKNESPVDTWPGGAYKNLLSFYVPSGSKLLSLNIGDDRKSTVSSFLRDDVIKKLSKNQFLVIEGSESGKTKWETVVDVPIKSTKTVDIQYELPKKLPIAEKFLTLEIFQQKQAGTDQDPFSFSINYPSFLKVGAVIPAEVLAKPQVVSYNTDLSTDRKVTIEFIK